MPGRLNLGDRWLLAAGGAIFAFMVVAAAILGGTIENQSDRPTTWSVGAGGAKAVFLLLPRLGYDVARWSAPPHDLVDAARTTLVVADPDEDPTPGERQAIAAFLAHGGRVVATGATGALLFDARGAERIVSPEASVRAQGLAPTAITRRVPSIAIAPDASWPASVPVLPLYGRGPDVLVARMPTAAGEAYWWAEATPLTNAGISEPGNLEFVLETLGPPDGRRILFDEYVHGARPTLFDSVMATPAKWVLVQLAAIGLVVVLAYSRRSGPVITPAVDSRLTSLEYVRTMGSLYRRARATVVPVDAAFRRLRTRLARRLGTAGDATAADLEVVLRDRLQVIGPQVSETLRTVDRALGRQTVLTPHAALALVRRIDAIDHAAQQPRTDNREHT